MLVDIKSHFCHTFYNTILNKVNKSKLKSVKILKISTFCIGWSNIALNSIIKNNENVADEETRWKILED